MEPQKGVIEDLCIPWVLAEAWRLGFEEETTRGRGTSWEAVEFSLWMLGLN